MHNKPLLHLIMRKRHINIHLSLLNLLYIRNIAVLHALKHNINLLQRFILRLDPEEVYKHNQCNIPTRVHDIRFPPHPLQRKRQAENTEQPEPKHEKRIQTHTHRANRVVQDLRRVEEGEGRPGPGIGSHEEEYAGDGAVGSCSVVGVSVEFC